MSTNEAWRWWLVDLSHCWHSNRKVSKYSECEVTRSQKCWCNWKKHWTTDQTQKTAKFEHRTIVGLHLQSFCDSLFSSSRHLKSYPYTLSPHVLTIRFVLVRYTIKHPLESQCVVICVDKLYRHFNVCKFHLLLTAMSANDVTVTTFM